MSNGSHFEVINFSGNHQEGTVQAVPRQREGREGFGAPPCAARRSRWSGGGHGTP